MIIEEQIATSTTRSWEPRSFICLEYVLSAQGVKLHGKIIEKSKSTQIEIHNWAW